MSTNNNEFNEKETKRKVIFTFVEAGLGHIVPATGIADAFEKKYGDKFEVVRWYIFSESANPIVRKYATDLFSWVKKAANNKVVAFSENISYMIGSKTTLKVLDSRFKKAKKAIIQEIVDAKPALICSTFYSPSHFALEARKMGLLDTIVATYTSDPVIYPAWDRRSDVFFVNNDAAHRFAVKNGFKEEQITQVPFILRKEIQNTTLDKKEARRALGLDEDKFTLLLASGAYGTKKDEKVVDEILRKNLNINFAVVCGKNEKLLEYCKNYKLPKNSNTTFHYTGFTNQMFLYNSSSNLMIGKSGANAMVESFYFGVPFFVTSSANLVEKYIREYYITEKGCGEKIFNPKTLGNKIEEIVSNPALLEKYKENLKPYNDFSGGEKVADKLYEMLNKGYRKEEK